MNNRLDSFYEQVSLRFQIYNSLFLTLPLDGVHQTGILLPLLNEACQEGFDQGRSPKGIMDAFFEDQKDLTSEKERLSQMFRFIQYIERQVVLVDALEDAAFTQVNDIRGNGSYNSLYQRASNRNALQNLKDALKEFRVRIVLTAHPTQFYPGAVLGIISDLDQAIRDNQLLDIERYLEQLGKTPFFKKTKPTPYDEAISLIWYLENIFYHSIPSIYREVHQSLGADAAEILGDNPLLQLGFWPGGDRDGNPFVSTDTTLQVADRLRTTLFKCYFRDIRKLRRRITFRGTEALMSKLHDSIFNAAFTTPNEPGFDLADLQAWLNELEEVLLTQHNGLFVDEVRTLNQKVRIFGFHFSTIDIRQDSRVISATVRSIEDSGQIKVSSSPEPNDDQAYIDRLFQIDQVVDSSTLKEDAHRDTIQSFSTIRQIKERNGDAGAYRYIISNCRGVVDVAHVHALARMSGWKGDMSLDIIPLFETIQDLQVAGEVMKTLYTHPVYKKHLANRLNKQVIMLGFSDGTKDGGYLTANWSIYQAKEDITKVSRELGITVTFFDGRGGPPARGGGNTHKFYASLGAGIESNRIQLTVQGQTISSNFGTQDSSRYNLEQLLSAGLENSVFNDPDKQLDLSSRKLIKELSEISYSTYQDFKEHPCFVPYLEKMSTLQYYGQTNIGSRPSKRGKGSGLKFEDLRAIPFVGAWSQLKQNVPGFYGLGTAFEKLDKLGRLDEVKTLYRESLFFRTLLENSMQSLSKSYFPLTAYMKDDPEFGEFWSMIHEESIRSRKYLLAISGEEMLLENNATSRESIKLRERVVLPLLTIQQYALMRIKELESTPRETELLETYKKLVIRSLYGNVNASRNSA